MPLNDPGLGPGDDTPVGTIRPITAELPRPDRPTKLGVRPDRKARRRGRRRRALRALLVLVVALVGYYAISLFQVWSTGRTDQVRQVDAIVVMGAAQYDGTPSPQLAARLDHVVALWPAGVAPLVVVTGGNQPGDRFTEAEASAAYLAERGVPPAAIIQETTGTTTYESMEGVAALLDERGLGSVLIVTDPYHALRTRLIAESTGLTAYTSPTTTSVVTGGRNLVRHLQEAAGVAVGRLVGFDRL
ncbi:MAG: YdcF family protein [Desertimonas sp.]